MTITQTDHRQRPSAKNTTANSPYPLPVGPHVTTWLLDVYTRLNSAYGDLKWWPADTIEEMVIGAILVQNVSWKNTVVALSNLQHHGLLSLREIAKSDAGTLASLIIPTRFYNMKAKRLQTFARHLEQHHQGEIESLLRQSMSDLRLELLAIPGIGPETADDIILYGAGYPSFVVDTYTRRILSRCGMNCEDVPYEELRSWFMDHLPADARLYNQFHALFDRVGSRSCLAKKPKCEECALADMCTFTTES